MLHKNQIALNDAQNSQLTPNLHLVSLTGAGRLSSSSSASPSPARSLRGQPALFELVAIAARRCSSFFAEAAVLVVVFGILDIFILRGHVETAWVAGALGLSLALLAASIATDFGAQRWSRAHP